MITRDLREIIVKERIIETLKRTQSECILKTAPTDRIHIGYLKPILKIIESLKSERRVIILIANLHAVLDSMKSTFEIVKLRSKYWVGSKSFLVSYTV